MRTFQDTTFFILIPKKTQAWVSQIVLYRKTFFVQILLSSCQINTQCSPLSRRVMIDALKYTHPNSNSTIVPVSLCSRVSIRLQGNHISHAQGRVLPDRSGSFEGMINSVSEWQNVLSDALRCRCSKPEFQGRNVD